MSVVFLYGRAQQCFSHNSICLTVWGNITWGNHYPTSPVDCFTSVTRCPLNAFAAGEIHQKCTCCIDVWEKGSALPCGHSVMCTIQLPSHCYKYMCVLVSKACENDSETLRKPKFQLTLLDTVSYFIDLFDWCFKQYSGILRIFRCSQHHGERKRGNARGKPHNHPQVLARPPNDT